MLEDPFDSSDEKIIGMFKSTTKGGLNLKIATFYKTSAFESMIKILEGDIEDDSL